MMPILGPARCGGCRREVFYIRWLGWSEPTNTKSRGWGRHRCYRGVRCGLLMPRAQARCAKRAGHVGAHRTRAALDRELTARPTNWHHREAVA